MKIAYIEKAFKPDSLAIIDQANGIIEEYTAQGFDLTLRQIYYQFVARDLIPNTMRSYKRLGSILNDARLAGMVDWNSMVDRTRNLETQATWTNPESIINACASSFDIDLWSDQEFRIEVWVEKDALIGVLQRVCDRWQVPYFSCRGYVSQSELWGAAQRLQRWNDADQIPLVIHLGDHDPSGIDMTRDVLDRLELLTGGIRISVHRIALNMDQVEKYNPPPNPTKITDSRAGGYIATHGDESWELDALEPAVIDALIDARIREAVDEEKRADRVLIRDEHRQLLTNTAAMWDDVVDLVS